MYCSSLCFNMIRGSSWLSPPLSDLGPACQKCSVDAQHLKQKAWDLKNPFHSSNVFPLNIWQFLRECVLLWIRKHEFGSFCLSSPLLVVGVTLVFLTYTMFLQSPSLGVMFSFPQVEGIEMLRLIIEKICLFLAMVKSLMNLFPLFFGYCKAILQ